MNPKSKELLSRLVSECEKTQKTSFPSIDFLAYPDSAIEELKTLGYIRVKNDVIASIELTKAGYEISKK